MTERPLYQYWPVLLAIGLFLGFALYNLCSALVYGAIIGSRFGNGWITFGARPYLFSFVLIIYVLTRGHLRCRAGQGHPVPVLPRRLAWAAQAEGAGLI